MNREFEVDGVKIPTGTAVVVPVYAIHHDPRYWPEPESFKPERFHPDVAPDKDDCRFLAFGGGPRTCIGKRMAWVVQDGRIEKVFYPVFPPDRNAADVIEYLRNSA